MKKFLAVLLFLVVSPIFSFEITKGVLHFDDATVLEKENIKLNGQWAYYPLKTFTHLTPNKFIYEWAEVPSSLEENFDRILRKTKDQYSYGVYRLLITGLEANKMYSIFSRESASSCSDIYANGKRVGKYGEFSIHKDVSRASQAPIFCNMISDENGEIELIIRNANYVHRKSGILMPIIFGKAENISKLFNRIIFITALVIGLMLFGITINLTAFIIDRKNTAGLYFTILLCIVMSRITVTDFSYLTWLWQDLPYGLQLKIEYCTVWISPIFFSLLYRKDLYFQKLHPSLDLWIAKIFTVFGIVLSCTPILISNYFEIPMMMISALFTSYSIYRCIFSFRRKNIIMGIYTLFYILIALCLYVDLFASDAISAMLVTVYEAGVIFLVLFDVIYVVANNILLKNKNEKLIAEQKEVNRVYKLFVSDSFLNILGKKSPKDVHLNDFAESNMTIMYILLKYINLYENITPENEFETLGAYMNKIGDCVYRHNGFIASVLGRGCMAVFPKNVEDAIESAKEIEETINTLGEKRMAQRKPLVSCHGGIHLGDVVVGVLGDENRFENTFISDIVNTSCRIASIAKMVGSTFLFSEEIYNKVKSSNVFEMKRFGAVKVKGKNSNVLLYEISDCKNESKELDVSGDDNISQSQIDSIVNNLWK